MSALADALNHEKDNVRWFAEIRTATEDGANQLTDNRAFSLQSLDGRVVKIGKGSELKFTSVQNGTLNFEQKTAQVTATRQVKLDTLTRDTRYDLSLLSVPDDKKERALLKLEVVRDLFRPELHDFQSIQRPLACLKAPRSCLPKRKPTAAPNDALAAAQTWITRIQNRVLGARTSSNGRVLKCPLVPYLPYISVTSAGNGAGSRFKIAVNGQTLYEGGADHRGLNVAAFSGEEMLLTANFDTSDDQKAYKPFVQALAKLPADAVVIIAVCDDASKNFNDHAYKALKSIGAKIALQGKPLHASYYCIGMPGLEEGAAIEEMSQALLEFPKK